VTCAGNDVETCTANGTYGSGVACNSQTCVNGVCTGVCAPGQTDCSGNTTQNCSSTGTWQNVTTCAQPTPSCVNGSCTCTETICGSSCTLLDTTSDCSACGDVCTLTNATSATCNGSTCSYTCNAGTSDCNTTAPNTGGCECLTPACCPGGTNTGAPCQTTHSDGLGNSYYDCNNLYTVTPNTFTPVTAMEACTGYAVSQGKTAANCSDGWSCAGVKADRRWHRRGPGHHGLLLLEHDSNSTDCANTCTYCWGYSANTDGAISDNGWVESCTCPEAKSASYN
jgi:hypothetical protein